MTFEDKQYEQNEDKLKCLHIYKMSINHIIYDVCQETIFILPRVD
jgi:hypothetical protein